jgi:hypothetical protein
MHVRNTLAPHIYFAPGPTYVFCTRIFCCSREQIACYFIHGCDACIHHLCVCFMQVQYWERMRLPVPYVAMEIQAQREKYRVLINKVHFRLPRMHKLDLL